MTEQQDFNKALVLEAFDTLFNRRDYSAAQRFWSPDYIQHSAHIAPGRDGLFDLVESLPAELRYENQLIVADGDLVVVAIVRELPDPRNAGKTYTTTWFDMWRIKDGKADEHWDYGTIAPPAPAGGAGRRGQ